MISALEKSSTLAYNMIIDDNYVLVKYVNNAHKKII